MPRRWPNRVCHLAFDPSYTGESGGYPRNVASPDINTEDFSAAVDFLACKEVDRNRIGLLGICGWGGMAQTTRRWIHASKRWRPASCMT